MSQTFYLYVRLNAKRMFRVQVYVSMLQSEGTEALEEKVRAMIEEDLTVCQQYTDNLSF